MGHFLFCIFRLSDPQFVPKSITFFKLAHQEYDHAAVYIFCFRHDWNFPVDWKKYEIYLKTKKHKLEWKKKKTKKLEYSIIG